MYLLRRGLLMLVLKSLGLAGLRLIRGKHTNGSRIKRKIEPQDYFDLGLTVAEYTAITEAYKSMETNENKKT